MDTNQEPTLPIAARMRQRNDGWTPEVQEAFIVALIEHGSVRAAASEVGRHITTAYRLRAREPAFAKAWDAARRLAYARLRDEAIDRALNGTPQQVWHDGEWVGMKRVHNDRLLLAMLAHLQHEPVPNAMRPADRDTVEERRSDSVAATLELLNPPPPPPPIVRLRPANGRMKAVQPHSLSVALG